MHVSPVSIALVAATLVIAPASAAPEIYKWVEADGSVHYGNTPPARTKNVRLVGMDSGTVSVVPGMSKEEKDRLREREDQMRLQRLELEVEELRAREQAREYAQPEVIYTDVYVPAYGYGRPLHRRDIGRREAAPGTANRQTKAAPPDAAHRGAKRPSYPDRSLDPPLVGYITTAAIERPREHLALRVFETVALFPLQFGAPASPIGSK